MGQSPPPVLTRRDVKGKFSSLVYACAVPVALLPIGVAPYLAFGLCVLVALIWVVPDVRIDVR